VTRLVCGIRSVDLNRSRLRVWSDRLTSGRADLYISNSEAGRRTRIERERIDARRIEVIHNGIDLDPDGLASREEARNALSLAPEDAPVVAHVANLRWMKGHQQALHAAKSIIARCPNAVFLFAGRDDSSGRFQAMARDLELGDRARFLGFHPRPREALRAADIAILPSLYEGCPVALLEAMAEGKPIAASDTGGIPELVRHEQEALLFAPGSAEGLAAAIGRLAGDATLSATLGRNARRRTEKEFDLDVMAEKYLVLYERLLG
jgi:glycosyltransferase involved in cell wall biosynthesis